MRIGPVGAEKPVARIDDATYVDLSELTTDIDEAFLGGGGLDRIRPVVAERAAAGEVSRFAGDLINTGTPPGVGMGQTPPVWLASGDVMELGVQGLGRQRQRVLGPR